MLHVSLTSTSVTEYVVTVDDASEHLFIRETEQLNGPLVIWGISILDIQNKAKRSLSAT